MSTVNEFNPSAQLLRISCDVLELLELQQRFFKTKSYKVLSECKTKEKKLKELAEQSLSEMGKPIPNPEHKNQMSLL